MSTYLLTWNPNHPRTWRDSEDTYRNAESDGFFDTSWRCGINFRQIKAGDRVFLLRQGLVPKGIVAAGVTMSVPYQEKTVWYVDVRFRTLLRPQSQIFPRLLLEGEGLKGGPWNARASGTSIPADIAHELEQAWCAHLKSLPPKRRRR